MRSSPSTFFKVLKIKTERFARFLNLQYSNLELYTIFK